MAITDWPEGERPREKLMQQGVAVLSDAELLAIFLRVGVTGKSAVDLARDLLTRFGSLNGIFAANVDEVCQVHGMGSSKYAQLQAIFEMSRRALAEEMQLRDVLSSPKQVRDYLCLKLGALTREVFVVLFLDAQNRVQAQESMFEGTLTQASVYPREVVKRALHHNAASVIFTPPIGRDPAKWCRRVADYSVETGFSARRCEGAGSLYRGGQQHTVVCRARVVVTAGMRE